MSENKSHDGTMVCQTKPNKDRSTHWILIRGLAREARHWGDFPDRLKTAVQSKAGGGSVLRVDAIDLPGMGQYSEMRSPISVAEMAEFARSKYHEIRRQQRESQEHLADQTFLLAVSLGGMVACSWFERWPEDLAGSILVNTSFNGFSPVSKRLLPSSLKYFYRAIRAGKDTVLREKNILELVSNRSEVRKMMAPVWAEIAESRPVSRENFFLQLLAAGSFRPVLERPTVPILIVSSLKDRLAHSSCSKAIADRWGLELRTHSTAGHDLPLDEPEWMIEQMVEWSRKIGR